MQIDYKTNPITKPITLSRPIATVRVSSAFQVPFQGSPAVSPGKKGIFSKLVHCAVDFFNKLIDKLQCFWQRLFHKGLHKDSTTPVPLKEEKTPMQQQEHMLSSKDEAEQMPANTGNSSNASVTVQNSEEPVLPLRSNNKLKQTNPEQAERLLDKDLSDAQDRFNRNASDRSLPEGKRAANTIRYGSDILNALVNNLKQNGIEINAPLIRDVQHINSELEGISLNFGGKKTFGELRESTQDRMISLIQFAVKHNNPMISNFGNQLGESIGLSKSTIEVLKRQD